MVSQRCALIVHPESISFVIHGFLSEAQQYLFVSLSLVVLNLPCNIMTNHLTFPSEPRQKFFLFSS